MVAARSGWRRPSERRIFDERFVFRQGLVQDLDGNRPIQQLVTGKEDVGGTTGCKLSVQLVAAREDFIRGVRHNR